MYPPQPGSYHAGVPVPVSPWMPSEFFQRGLALSSPRMFPTLGMFPGVLPNGMERREEHKMDSVYTQVDPRIPFTNYFMNLTKLFRKDAGALQSPTGSEENEKRSMERHEVNKERRMLSPTIETDKIKDELKYKSLADDRQDTQTCETSSPNFASTSSFFSTASNPLSTAQMDSLASLHPFSQTNPLFHLMGGMAPPPGGLIHPAFLQMAGLGNKRLNPEKPPPVKKYKCDVCGKAFSRSNTLVTHKVRIHLIIR